MTVQATQVGVLGTIIFAARSEFSWSARPPGQCGAAARRRPLTSLETEILVMIKGMRRAESWPNRIPSWLSGLS